MRKSRLVKGWGILLVITLCIAGYTPLAGGAGSDGISVNMQNVPFYKLVQWLVEQDNGKKLEQVDVLSNPVSLITTDKKPVFDLLSDLCSNNGMEVKLENDTYVVKKRDQGNAAQGTNPAPIDQTPTDTIQLPQSNGNTQTLPVPLKYDETKAETGSGRGYVETIELENTSVGDICWLLGVGNTTKHPPSRDEQRVLNARIQPLLYPHQPVVNENSQGQDYSSPMLGSSLPWAADPTSGTGGTGMGNQFFPGPGAVPGGIPGAVPGGIPGTVPGVTPVPGTTTNGTTTNGLNANQGGQLESFVPDGIEQIVGISSLNQLLVRSKSRDAIIQLRDFLKLIDKPTKQVVVELMFVKMSVQDAFSLGASFRVSGTPFYTESQGQTNTGNFTVMFTQGNLQAQLTSMITNKRAKVVNAPRVVVQNGGGAMVMFTETIPFVISTQNTDIYGRITTTPTIQAQQFMNGMVVNNATILPDNSVILNVTPQVDDPTDAVQIPGQGTSSSGSVFSSQSTQIQGVIVRVKNGESMMMGGFVSTNNGTASTRVPLLSDLPIIGPILFRNTNNSSDNTETLFFLTPTIIFDDKTNFDGMTAIPPVF